MKDDDYWIRTDIIPHISPKYYRLVVALSLVHDLGKIDGKRSRDKFIKPRHPTTGHSMVISMIGTNCPSEESEFSRICKAIKTFSENTEIQTEMSLSSEDILHSIAFISLFHQKLGDIMKGEITVSKYLSEFKMNLPRIRIPPAQLLYITILISLADVRGAWPRADLQDGHYYCKKDTQPRGSVMPGLYKDLDFLVPILQKRDSLRTHIEGNEKIREGKFTGRDLNMFLKKQIIS